MSDIRFAMASEVPRLVELARREHEISPWACFEFDAGYVSNLMREFIETTGRTILCTSRGYVAGLVQPAGFSGRLIAMEYACFAEDGQGLALLREFESWGRSMGAAATVVHDYIGGSGRLSNVLQRRAGYKPLGAALVHFTEGAN